VGTPLGAPRAPSQQTAPWTSPTHDDMEQDRLLLQHQSSMESRASFTEAERRGVAKRCSPELKPRLGRWLPKEGKYLLALLYNVRCIPQTVLYTACADAGLYA